jgi:hypothetical protein
LQAAVHTAAVVAEAASVRDAAGALVYVASDEVDEVLAHCNFSSSIAVLSSNDVREYFHTHALNVALLPMVRQFACFMPPHKKIIFTTG